MSMIELGGKVAVVTGGSSGIGLEFLTIAPPHQDRLDRMIQQLQPKTGL